MKYYIAEVQVEQGVKFTAGTKARDDIETILTNEGYSPIYIEVSAADRKSLGEIKKIITHVDIKKKWDKKTSILKRGDELVIQFPVIHHSLLLYQSVKKLVNKGVKVSLLIHDLETFRASLRKDNSLKKKIRLQLEEKSLLQMSNKIIVHNEKMKQVLIKLGIDGSKLVNLEIFDYLIPDFEEKNNEKSFSISNPVIIAGALRPHKAKYAYDLPQSVEFNLYGVGYEGGKRNNVHYFGAFPPEELPFCLVGSFGLVWDGDASNTCTGIYGEYLKINNPHKTSLYLASGIPVVIWKKAALAEFVTENKCGIVVDSIADIPAIIKGMTEDEYEEIIASVIEIGKKIRNGYFTKKALEV